MSDNQESDKKAYELCFLLTAAELESEIVSALKQARAEVASSKPPTLIQLAYPVKKQTSAYFGHYQFKALPADAKLLKESLGLNSQILRFLVLALPKRKTVPVRDYGFGPKSAPVAAQTIEAKKVPIQSSGTLSNEALEKTLEEILK